MFITRIRKQIAAVVTMAGVVIVSYQAQAGCISMFPTAMAATSAASAAELMTTPYVVLARSTDPVGPFPLAVVLPFPWAKIQGIWMMKYPDGRVLHFSFDVREDCDGRKIIQVIGFDQKNYQEIEKGYGVAISSDTIIRAVMTSATSQHMLFIRQLKPTSGKSAGKTLTVVTIRPFDGGDQNDVHMIATKASDLPLAEYVRQKKEAQAKREADIRKRSGRP